MTTTPNYGFSIAEGTDNVNLLTQSYPNFTNLDSILKTIEETGITTSVATKVGTVFQIVRTNTDLAVMRFVATANYAAGDTFTVDGVSVTATGMNGAALPAGAFVINQSVECILNGTVLTVVGVAGATSVAAQDVTYDNTGSGLTATDVQNAIDEVLGDIPANAAALSYDNTVSGLTATDVQAAIDEVYAAVPTSGEYVSVVTDGVKTYKQVFNELFALIDFSKVTGKSYIDLWTSIFHPVVLTAGNMTFSKSYLTAANSYTIQYMQVNVSDSKFWSDANGTGNDSTNNVVPAGNTLKLYY